MRVALGLVGAIVLVAGAVVALAPASLVDRVVVQRTDGRVRLADAQGFWWKGHGVVTSTDARGEVPVAWRVHVLPFVRGRVVVDFVAAQPGMPSGTIDFARGDVEMHDLSLTLPAALLPAFVPSLAIVAPHGDIDVRAASFAWGMHTANGHMDLGWRDARLAIAGFPVALGNIVAAASGTGDGMGGTFVNRGGELGVRGTWRVAKNAIEATTTLTPSDATPPALRTVLPMLGRAESDGSVRIEWRGRP